jgi:hypothetical protein
MIAGRILAVLSLLVLGAHFLRTGLLPAVILCLALVVLVFIPRRWARLTVQAALALSTIEWVRTTLQFIAERRAFEQPWLRLALIMGAVITLTLVAALLLGKTSNSSKPE